MTSDLSRRWGWSGPAVLIRREAHERPASSGLHLDRLRTRRRECPVDRDDLVVGPGAVRVSWPKPVRHLNCDAVVADLVHARRDRRERGRRGAGRVRAAAGHEQDSDRNGDDGRGGERDVGPPAPARTVRQHQPVRRGRLVAVLGEGLADERFESVHHASFDSSVESWGCVRSWAKARAAMLRTVGSAQPSQAAISRSGRSS